MYKRFNLLSLLMICLFFIIGITIYKDYGVGFDGHVNRKNGEISYNYVVKQVSNLIIKDENELLKARENLDNYRDRDYGVAFDLPVMAIEKFLKLENSQNQYLLRSGFTHLLFLISLFYFFNIIYNRFNSEKLGLVAVGLIYINPRIFAESFFNNKDIVFMSLFIIALYYSIELIKKQNFKICFLASLTTALAIDIRIVGVVLPGIVLVGWFLEIFKNKNILINHIFVIYFLLYLLLIIFFTIAFWPWLWTDPVNHFIEAFKNMANFRWINWVYYRGHYHVSSDLPWHYLPLWISITTPIVYLLLFLSGILVLFKRTVSYKFNLYKNQNELIDLIVASLFLAPIIAVIILKSTTYDGWRQFYFLYPPLVYISILGLSELIKNKFKYIIMIILLFEITGTAYWMVNNHPYQYVYFNKFGGKDVYKNFEMDYWGVTNVDLLKKILKEDNSANIKVYSLGQTSIPYAFSLLNYSDAIRITQTTDINDADYVITNHRSLNKRQAEVDFKEIEVKFNNFFEISVDNNIIGSVFKKLNN